jgi:hypothetical protein
MIPRETSVQHLIRSAEAVETLASMSSATALPVTFRQTHGFSAIDGAWTLPPFTT